MSLTGSVLLYDGGNNLVGAYSTIQAAIDASSNGYTVWASAGTYNENLERQQGHHHHRPQCGHRRQWRARRAKRSSTARSISPPMAQPWTASSF